MLSFKQYLLEVSSTGNYVAMKVSNPHMINEFLSPYGITPNSGETPPNNDYHCTLIYSMESNVECDRIKKAFSEQNFSNVIHARISGLACFDSLPENGVRDIAKSCVVMKLDSPELHKIHDWLRSFGLRHSYPEFEPHVTLRYNMNVEEAHSIRDLVNNELNKGNETLLIELDSFYSEPINKDYV